MLRARETTGLVLVLDDWADYAFNIGDMERAARLLGAARHLQDQTSTGLAEWSNLQLRQGGLPFPDFDEATRERLKADGAALSVEDAIALGQAADIPPDRVPATEQAPA